jgi:Cytidylate kinase-like family
MAVWTISAQAGTGGEDVAARLAAAAGAPLLDRKTLALYAHRLNPLVEDGEELEARVGGALNLAALSLAMTTGSVEAFLELQLRKTLPELGRAVLTDAARRPCVIFAAAAFAALPEHPFAIHVRLRAPLDWRIANHRREHLVDRRCAEKAVKHDDHLKHAWVKTLYHVDVDDLRLFSVVLDASRSSTDRLVEILLAAGGVPAVEPVHH